MPTIRIDYDDRQLKDEEILSLSEAAQKIVQKITGIEDTFVYAQSPHIKVKIAPIELYVQISAGKVKDIDALFQAIKEEVMVWKKESSFRHSINLTLMPMQWKFEVGL